MKKISVKKEILVIMMLVVMILAVSSQVFATGTSNGPIGINIIAPETNSEANPTNETTTPQTTNTVTPTTNTVGSTYQNATSLPQTGDASDYAIFMLIVVAIVVAIYAYKKVREYNIK